MKFLVFSDIHSASPLPILQRAADYDGVIFLGDGERVLPQVREKAKKLYAVCGNCDVMSDLPEEDEVFAAGRKLLICHGHRFYAKYGTAVLAEEARGRGCDAVLFGHTHVPCSRYENGLYVLNPGASSGGTPTFGVLDVTRDGIMFSVLSLRDGKMIL